MASGAQTILNDLLAHEHSTNAPNSSESDFFEIFTAEQIVKNYGLSYDEIESGIIDYRGGDGGVDSVYTFVNGVLATEDAEYSNIRENALITLTIIQSKGSPGFSDEAILRLRATVRQLLDLSHNLNNYIDRYNPELLRAIRRFRDAYRTLMPTSPTLEINFYYVTKGDEVHPNVRATAEELKDEVKHLLSESKPAFIFVGASDLLSLYRKAKVQTIPLNVSDALSTPSKSTICLVTLKDFYDFIHDTEIGQLRAWLFEENIRDYEGRNVDVNKSIRQTLEHQPDDQDFWWLNNGLTIVTTKAPLSGKTLNVQDPKIVNGLQTSMEIYNHFRLDPNAENKRNILLRVIVTSDEKTRNAIIKATNSQSAIKAASLRAFDPIHYQIEQYLGSHDLYYDRRKNFYKNQNKPKNQIISIQYLAQAVAAILLQRPNDSRGRPINLIKNDMVYRRIFNEQYPIELYLECTRFMKSIDQFLESTEAPEYVRGHEINVHYQLAMFAAALKAKQLSVTSRYIQKNGLKPVDSKRLNTYLKHVWEILQKQRGKEKELDEDRVAKSPEFDAALKLRLREILKSKTVSL